MKRDKEQNDPLPDSNFWKKRLQQILDALDGKVVLFAIAVPVFLLFVSYRRTPCPIKEEKCQLVLEQTIQKLGNELTHNQVKKKPLSQAATEIRLSQTSYKDGALVCKKEAILQNHSLDKRQSNQEEEINKGKLRHLKTLFLLLDRYIYLGNKPSLTDPSRVEIFDPVGKHFATDLTIPSISVRNPINANGFRSPVSLTSISKKVEFPALTQTTSFNYGRFGYDVLINTLPLKKSSRASDLLESLSNSIKISFFRTRSITQRSDRLESNLVFRRVLMDHFERKHELMTMMCPTVHTMRRILRQIAAHNAYQNTQRTQYEAVGHAFHIPIVEATPTAADILASPLNPGPGATMLSNPNHPDPASTFQPTTLSYSILENLSPMENRQNPVAGIPSPLISANAVIGAPTSSLYHDEIRIVNPSQFPYELEVADTSLSLYSMLNRSSNDHRCIHIMKNDPYMPLEKEDQMKSLSVGHLYEISLLNPIFTLLQVNPTVQSLEKYCAITIKRTSTDSMTTNLAQVEVKLSEMGFDVLRKITEEVSTRLPVIQPISPALYTIINVMNSVVEVTGGYQSGFQKSDCTNFNHELEHQRVRRNEIFFENRNMAGIRRDNGDFSPPAIPNAVDPSLREVNHRSFQEKDCYIRFNVNLTKIFLYLATKLDDCTK
jgi:hypothetical protein